MKNRKPKNKIVLTLLFCLLQLTAFTQEKTITGKVVGADGTPLPGVSIVIKGTTTGTITDLDGNYSITVSDASNILVYSFIGFKTVEEEVGDRTTLDITLNEDLMELDEIVVVGYGVTKKSDLTGAMASLKEEDFNTTIGASPEQLIQGRVAGVQITSNNGEPGAGSQIRIRGTSTVRSGSQPLYVVDGVPLDFKSSSPDGPNGTALGGAPASNPLTFINPNDIESIDILKDASAAAIYGARGANGVVIITTKKGKEGKSQVSYSATASISKLPKKLDVLNADEFIQLRVENDNDIEVDDPNHYGADTDWQDVLFRTAYSQSHNLSLSGGSEKSTFRTSLGYLDQEGIMEKSDLKQYSGRINLTQKTLNDRLFLESNITASQVIQNRPPVGTTGFEGDILLSALKANPTWPTELPGGDPFQTGSGSERNPAAMLAYTDDLTRTTRILGNLAGTIDIIEGLTFKVNLGLDYTNANRQINQSQKLDYMAARSGSGQINNKELYNYLIENTLNYNKLIGDHNISLLVGYSYQDYLERGSNTTAGGFASDGILYTNRMQAGLIQYAELKSWADTYQMQSFFGRANYNLMERYLVTATLRIDGSSKFGENNKYGYFPSFSLAWRISEESFMENLDAISNLKIRGGWGQTGNSEIGTKNSQYLYSPDEGSRAILGSEVVSGFSISRTPNPDITWETTTSTNIGLDVGILNGKFSGTFDLFRKTTTDILLAIPAPAGSPTETVIRNIDSCKIINKGIELSLTAFPISTPDFSWEITATMTFQDNIVKDLPVEQYQTGLARGQGLTDQYVQIITSDEPMNVFVGLQTDSIDEEGEVYYLQTEAGGDSLTYLGDPQPNFVWGLNNKFRYKKFDLSFFIEGVHGNTIFNNTALLLDKSNLRQASNALRDFAYDELSYDYDPAVSDRYMEDGSYVRLSNVTLGYTWNFQDFEWLSHVRFYISGNNLLLLTDYSGFDPDVSSSSDIDDIKSYGLDITNYPKSRSFLVGLNVTF